MRKFVINYTSGKASRRLVINRDLPYSDELLCAVLRLHIAKIVTLNNILPITEVVCA